MVVIVVGAIIIFSVLIGTGIIYVGQPSTPHSSNKFTPPSQIPCGNSLVEISNPNYAGQNAVSIYFDPWIGGPIGAKKSWVIYGTISNYGVIKTSDVTYNY